MQRVRELQPSAAGQGQLEIEDFAADHQGRDQAAERVVRHHQDRRPGRPHWSPERPVVAGGQRRQRRVPGWHRVPDGRGVLRRAGSRTRAAVADVVVVNMHLYGLTSASGGMLLPEHDVVVIDEAHQLEDIMSDTVGVQIGPGRFTSLAAVAARIIDDPASRRRRRRGRTGRPRRAAAVRRPATVRRRSPTRSRTMLDRRARPDREGADRRCARSTPTSTRRSSASCAPSSWRPGCRNRSTSRSATARATSRSSRGGPDHPRLEIAPLDVGPVLANGIWSQRTAILTSATIPASLAASRRAAGRRSSTRSTSAARSTTSTTRCSTARCTCPTLARRSSPPAVHDEIAALITAAGGRTLALFTSWKAMDAAAAAVQRPGRRADPHPARPARRPRWSRRSATTSRRACSRPPASSRASTFPGER